MFARSILRTAAAAAFLATLASGGAAEAASYSVTGTYEDHRGAIELPLPSGLGLPGPGVPISDTTFTQMGAAVPGGGPATIGIPMNAISSAAGSTRGFLIPIPAIVQLTSMGGHYGPTAADTLMASAGPGSTAFCPGMTAASCTTPTRGSSQGTLAGIIKYTAGPNKFGGTLRILTKGGGNLASKGAVLPPTVMTSMGATLTALPFSVENAPVGGTQIVGAGTSGMFTNILGAAVATHPLGYMTTPLGLLSPGPVVGAGPGNANTATAFGFTTGTVVASEPFGAQSNTPAAGYKFTITGYDKRTAGGAGRISLVSGGLSRLYPTDGSNPPEGSTVDHATIVLTFVPQPALPLASPALMGTLGTLVMLGAGYAVSSKR